MAVLLLITCWALAELLYFSLQLFNLAGRRRRVERSRHRPRFRKALWLDVLCALDDDTEAGMARLVQVMSGGTDEASLRKGNVEEFLAVQLFGAELAAVKRDPLLYHQLCSAIADLEKRRNKRFVSGYAEGLAPANTKTAAASSRVTPVAARLGQLIIQLLEHWASLALGFTHALTSMLNGPSSSGTKSMKQPIIWLYSTETHISRLTRLSTLRVLRRQGYHVSIVDIGPESTAQLPQDVITDLGSSTVIAESPALPLLADLIRSGTAMGKVIALDPSVHPLFGGTAGYPSQTDAGDGDSAALHTLCSNVRQVSIISTINGREQDELERYCKLRSVPFAVANRHMPLSECIAKAIDRLNIEDELAVEKVVVLVKTPGGQQAEVMPVRVIPQSSLAMMPSLENISSIGMCLAPPLRTRQRSRSMGTVIGYGHIAGLPVDPAVVVPVRMGRQISRTSSWTAPVKV